MNEILERIFKLINERNLTQQKFAEDIGVKQQVVTDWKKGRNESYMKYINKIADCLDTSVDYLLGKKQSKTPLPDKATAEEWRKILESMEMTELIDILQDVSAEIKLRQHGQDS